MHDLRTELLTAIQSMQLVLTHGIGTLRVYFSTHSLFLNSSFLFCYLLTSEFCFLMHELQHLALKQELLYKFS